MNFKPLSGFGLLGLHNVRRSDLLNPERLEAIRESARRKDLHHSFFDSLYSDSLDIQIYVFRITDTFKEKP